MALTVSGRSCARCGTHYAPHLVVSAFPAMTAGGRRFDASKRRWVCRPCEQTARDERKAQDRWAAKARDVIRRHAPRLHVDKQDLIDVYGWDPARLAHDAQFQYGNGCSYCGYKYQVMGHGLADITLDIMDRAKPPYYRTNTKWCCQTCNRQKGDKTPEWFEANRQVYEAWTASAKRSAEERGMLFTFSDAA